MHVRSTKPIEQQVATQTPEEPTALFEPTSKEAKSKPGPAQFANRDDFNAALSQLFSERQFEKAWGLFQKSQRTPIIADGPTAAEGNALKSSSSNIWDASSLSQLLTYKCDLEKAEPTLGRRVPSDQAPIKILDFALQKGIKLEPEALIEAVRFAMSVKSDEFSNLLDVHISYLMPVEQFAEIVMTRFNIPRDGIVKELLRQAGRHRRPSNE